MKQKHDSPPSITPQRKHRKLLKDGSGTEVWPESVEKVFVQGLREYWDSPYATYSQSRGRSRWRNQFLVDYLHKHSIDRSKKQVASHIQVLRNMWKGEPEFHLVAGGDELYTESGSPVPVKVEDQLDGTQLIPCDWDDHDRSYSNPVSPDFSPADSQSEFPPTPEHRPNLFPTDFAPVPNKIHGHSHSRSLDLPYPTPLITSPSISPDGNYIQQLPPFHDSAFAIHSKYSPVSPLAPQSPYHMPLRRPAADTAPTSVNRHHSLTPTHSTSRNLRNKVLSIFLQADGMTPLTVKVDALGHPSTSIQPPFSLRIRLCVPPITDARTPPTLHGFLAGIALDSVWSITGRCTTKVYENNNCISDESGFLSITHINVGTVNVVLPESSLNRCRWLNAASSFIITQEIVVDDETLLFVIYDLDRRNGGSLPSASLLGYQSYRATDKSTPSPVPPSPSNSFPATHALPYGRSTTQSTLPYAVTPMRYPSSSGLNF